MLSMRWMLNLRHALSHHQPSKLHSHTTDCTDDSPANVDAQCEHSYDAGLLYMSDVYQLYISYVLVTFQLHMGPYKG